MILIIGATGRIGGEAARILRANGQDIRVLVRDPDTPAARALADLGAGLVTGDLADPSTLDPAMKGADRVLLVSVQDPNQAEYQGNAVEAALRHDVGHIVKVSGVAPSISPGGPAEIGRQHWQTEHQIEETGIPFTFLRPNFFMQNLLENAAPMVAKTGVLAAPMGSALIGMVDARDVAASAAAVLVNDDHFERVYDITGPRALNFDQLAAVLARATGRSVRYINTPPAMATKVLNKRGLEDWYVRHLMEMAEMFRAGAGAHVSTAVADLTGHAPRTIEDFAAENAASFSQDGQSPIIHVAARLGIGLAARAASLAGR